MSTKNEILLSCKGCLDRSSSGLLIRFRREVPGSHLTKWGQIAWLVVGCVYAKSISVVAVSINLAIHLILSTVLFSYFFSVSLYFVCFYPLLSGLFNSLFYHIYVRKSTCCIIQTREKRPLTEIWLQDVFTQSFDGFGGLVLSMLASGTQVCGFKPGRSRWIFRGKNPQHAFLRRGSKRICPMSQLCGM